MMRYFDIHVKYGERDKDGFSAPISVKGNAEEAVRKAVEEELLDECDVEDIDNITEIDEEEYIKMTR
jgi:DNA-directed RNA polymerase specialized sigma subunit